MKLRNLIPLAALAFLLSCGPTTYELADGTTIVVPRRATTDFMDQYPTADAVVWSYYDVDADENVIVDFDFLGWPVMTESDYVVTFNMDGQPHFAWYDADGTWIGTAQAVGNINTLPASINTVVVQRFPDFTITSATREMWGDTRAYEVHLQSPNSKMKVLIDENGTILKQKVKE